MTSLEILSILLPIFTLSTLRDDFTALQHHRDQIQRLENRYSSDRAWQGSTIATLYWDKFGEIKAVFNMGTKPQLVEIPQSSGANIVQAVEAECQRWFQPGAVSLFLVGARWGAQLGYHWRNILHRPSSVATITITIQLQTRFTTPPDIAIVLGELRKCFEQGGNSVLVVQVPNALTAGNTTGNSREESIIAKGRALADAPFCKAPIQNRPFTFLGGKLDGLLKEVIRCPNWEIGPSAWLSLKA